MLDTMDTMAPELGATLGLAWGVGLAWLLLFALRRRIGWSPLWAAVVGLQVWSITHGTLVPAAPGLWVGGGWLALTAWPLMVLLVHVREGTHRARELAIAVLVGMLAVTLAGAWLSADPVAWVIRGLARGVLSFVAALSALVTWEVLGQTRFPVPLRLLGALLLSLAGDAAVHGGFEALLAGDAFEHHVLGTLSMAVVATLMHGALGTLWLLVLEGERWATAGSDRSVFEVLGVMLGLQRYEPMRPHVVRDPASGLYHRTFLEDRAPVEFERAEHLAASVAVLVLDARDDPARVGRALLSSMRLTDLPAAWSSQRYVAILPGAHADAARTTASKAIKGFRGEAAVGIAVFPHDGATLDALIDRARSASRPISRD